MTVLAPDDPLAVAVAAAIRSGDGGALERLLADDPALATARLGGEGPGGEGPGVEARTLLHIATDWPGHFPNVAATIDALVRAGADVDASFTGGHHEETPLHWAASSDDVAALDALLDAGADIEAQGSVIDGTTPLMDAVAFAQWRAARRLVERGARVTPWQASALGLVDTVDAFLNGDPAPSSADVNSMLWAAGHGGQLELVQRLVAAGGEVDWAAPWDGTTPLEAAERSEAADVAAWLRTARG